MIFSYKAMDSKGKKVKGEIEADTSGEAIRQLKAMNLRMRSIGLKQPSAWDQIKGLGLKIGGQRLRNRIKMRQMESLREELMNIGFNYDSADRELSNFNRMTFDIDTVRKQYGTELSEIQYDKIKAGRRSSQSRRNIDGSERKSLGISLKSRRVPLDELVIFTEQLSILLSTGVQMDESLETVSANLTNRKFREVIDKVAFDMSAGYLFSKALSEHPDVFSAFYIALVRVAEEAGGEMPNVLADIVKQLKMRQRLKREMKKAAIYPSIVLFVLIGIIIFMNYVMIPKFRDLFEGMNFELPWITEVIFTLSENSGMILVTTGILIAVSVFLYTRFKHIREQVKVFVDFMSLRIPLLNVAVLTGVMYQLTLTLSLTLKNNINITDSLNLVNNVMGNGYVKRDIEDIYFSLEDGKSLPESFNSQKYISNIVKMSVSAGDKSGQLPETLSRVSEYYEVELEAKLEAFIQFIVPMSILLLAVVIAPFLVGVYIPISSMASQINNSR